MYILVLFIFNKKKRLVLDGKKRIPKQRGRNVYCMKNQTYTHNSNSLPPYSFPTPNSFTVNCAPPYSCYFPALLLSLVFSFVPDQ